ncbi:MAG: efflux RND transporter periplasmic adaptor subunit, partial [Chloroflexota bacterium]|nr:efflux RND transporter periplasmic adaptor subunit [Chloroflexota bacterium]
YIPETFNYSYRDEDTREWVEEIDAPTEAEIALARAEVAVVETNLVEAQNLLAALKGKEVPEDATGSNLVQLEQALLAIANIEEAIEETQLITSLSGIVTSLNAQVPDQVTQNPILTIAAVAPHTLEVYFDESDWGKIKVGYEVEVIFDALPEKTFVGQVAHVDPALATEQNTTVVRSLVELDISTTGWNNLPLNSAASVDVIGGRAEGVVTVPVEALRAISDGEYAVFVLEDGEPRMRMVEVGIQDLLYAEIKSGLKVGDVVTTGQVETE